MPPLEGCCCDVKEFLYGQLLYLYTMVFVLLRVVWRECLGGPGAMSESFMIEAVGGLQVWLLRLLYGR